MLDHINQKNPLKKKTERKKFKNCGVDHENLAGVGTGGWIGQFLLIENSFLAPIALVNNVSNIAFGNLIFTDPKSRWRLLEFFPVLTFARVSLNFFLE